MINFAYNAWEIVPESLSSLESVVEMMSIEFAVGKGIVEGYTDNLGSYAYDQKLSDIYMMKYLT